MLLCHPLAEVLASRGIADIDTFLKAPSLNDLPDPFSIPSMEQAVSRGAPGHPRERTDCDLRRLRL
jgi:hypothetical protein